MKSTEGRIHFSGRKAEMTEKRTGFSFRIEDILGDTEVKRKSYEETAYSFSTPSTVNNRITEPVAYCPSAPVSPLYSPRGFPSRFGYPSPIAVSPSLAYPTRHSESLAFFPSDFNEQLHNNYLNMRHESILRSGIYSPSVILDLSNYVPKTASARVPTHHAGSSLIDCSGGRPIIWKHISRNPAKRKGGQIRFTSEQTTTLENTFGEHKYLSSSERKRLAVTLRLSERQVKTWFQNRRAKWRRIKQEPAGQASNTDSEDDEPRRLDFSDNDPSPMPTFV